MDHLIFHFLTLILLKLTDINRFNKVSVVLLH